VPDETRTDLFRAVIRVMKQGSPHIRSSITIQKGSLDVFVLNLLVLMVGETLNVPCYRTTMTIGRITTKCVNGRCGLLAV
jgi:hypothetical protein